MCGNGRLLSGSDLRGPDPALDPEFNKLIYFKYRYQIFSFFNFLFRICYVKNSDCLVLFTIFVSYLESVGYPYILYVNCS